MNGDGTAEDDAALAHFGSMIAQAATRIAALRQSVAMDAGPFRPVSGGKRMSQPRPA